MKSLIILIPLLIIFFSCSKVKTEGELLEQFPANNLVGVVSSKGIEADKNISFDGKGSLKLTADSPTVFQLYETGDINVEDATLTYSAQLKTDNVQGQVYLEMWCVFNNNGEYFSRALDQSLAGTNDWKSVRANFFLKSGENPDNVRLNVVIAGTGTAWVDDIKVEKK